MTNTVKKSLSNRLNTQAFVEAANRVHGATQKMKTSGSLAGIFQEDDAEPFFGSVMGDVMESLADSSRRTMDDFGLGMNDFGY